MSPRAWAWGMGLGLLSWALLIWASVALVWPGLQMAKHGLEAVGRALS